MLDSLKLTARTLRYGAGIYEAGDTAKCNTRLFVTESERVLPINHGILTEEDLLEVYSWGFEDGRGSVPTETAEAGDVSLEDVLAESGDDDMDRAYRGCCDGHYDKYVGSFDE